MEPNVLAAVREASLPEGLQSLLDQFDDLDDLELDSDNVQIHEITTRLIEQLELTEKSNSSNNTSNSSTELINPISPEDINSAILIAGQKGSKKYLNTLLYAMEKLELPLPSETVTTIMQKFIELGDYSYAEVLFEKSIDVGTNPNSDAWAELVKAKAYSGNLDDAQKTMDRLIKIGVNPTTTMYVSILKSLLTAKKNDEAFEYWMRMKAEGVKLNVEAYNLMLQHCNQTYNPERAFLYFDEMRGYGRNIQPNAESFAKLFEVCGHAPMWVNGYQDTIFDAMAVMEGAEFPPTTEIYNNIIRSFGQGGDCAASEFYFWEMRQKGIPQTCETYNALFTAFGLCQRVGHGPYMIKPRYVRPPEPEKTELEEIVLKAGALETFKFKAESFTSDGLIERGKRQRAKFVTTDDEVSNEEYNQQLIDSLKARTSGKPNLYEEMLRRDEENKKLYHSETGRTITLDLLAKGVDPGPGEIVHILPSADDEVEEPTNEELFSIGQDLKKNSSLEEDLADANDLPDDDPEFLKFMEEFKSSMGESNFDEMLDTLSKKADGNSDGNNFLTNSNGKFDNPFAEYESAILNDENDYDAERLARAKESLSDMQKGLFDLETMTPGRVPIRSRTPIEEELENLKQMKAERQNQNNKNNNNNENDNNNNNNNSNSNSKLPTKPFNFDSIDLGDPALLNPSNLVSKKEKNHLLALLDNEAIPDELGNNQLNVPSYISSQKVATYSLDEDGAIPEDEVDRQWNYILFARCPEPDYSKPLPERRKEHIIRANTLYQDMIKHNIEPNIDTMNSYLSVFTEATKLDDALNLLDKFASQHDLVPNEKTYYHLVRMHIYLKDIDGALNRFNEMKERDIVPSGKTYGSLIQSYAHRDKLVEALKLLEEAHDRNIHISDTYIKKLRARCEAFGLSHPYIPPDPNQWVKDVKEIRKKSKGRPVGSKIHLARSLTFH